MILHNAIQVKREPADFGTCRIGGLVPRRDCVRLQYAGPVRDVYAGPDVLNHSPSPFGRTGRIFGRPPVFSCLGGGEKTLYKQCFAQNARAARRGLDMCRDLYRLAPKTLTEESRSQCVSNTGPLPLSPAAGLPPVATHSNNKRSSGRGPGLPVPPSSTATLPPVRLSARRPMSPTASNTRRAATKRAAPAIVPVQILRPIAALRRGGVFVAIAPGPTPGGREPEGTRDVQ